ncbi:MAG: general secretion pathway protein GspK [Candidatus Hydrogenedentes bacterium]|nr:general secretion pathway protein GspK [Candidatus Hydrogenedentota bacterium]
MTRREEGFVLVAMIWIIAILAVVTLGFAHRSLLDQRAAALALDHSKAQYLARGSVNYAVADMRNKAFMEGLLAQARAQLHGTRGGFRARSVAPPAANVRLTDKAPNLIETGGMYSADSGGEGNTASYSVVDAEGRISVNTAPEEVLDNIEGLGMRTVFAIMRRRGSELSPEERAPFLAIEELRQLEDIDEDAWEGDDDSPGLRDLFTIHGDGRINVNTASREVLAAIPDLDESTVDRIIGYRQGDDGKLGTGDDRQFRSLDTMSSDLEINPTDLAPLARYCTFESHFFTITGFATQRQGKVRAAAQAVVNIQPGSAVVLSWSEGEFGP